MRPLTWSQRILAAVGGVFFAGLAGLGGYGSFASVRDVAEPWFGGQAWIVPAGVDLGILALVSVALLLEWLAMPMPALRWMAMAFTGATVWLNVSAADGDPAGVVMHAAMPVLFVTFVEAVRHAIRRRAGIAAGIVREGIPIARWLLAPFSTFCLWRRMVLWQITSYPRALVAEQRRRHALALLRDRYGRTWKRQAPADVVWMLSDGVMLDQALARVTEIMTPPPPPAPSHPPDPRPAQPTPHPVPEDKPPPAPQSGPRPPAQAPSGRQTAPPPTRASALTTTTAGTEARAQIILAAEPGITGAELGRRLQLSPRQGQRLLNRLTRPTP
ncbi:DUF2637 domain-containing protein [Actinomadura graeca]|uniref:DUF2637 domain-containing protein n=1 Tax=Actinomadura graeca TaxID=2750812 RepID=A0ABX8QYP6_9ACTN|nr:DUF2637 domain-containing protein [Actinomadura graeca]QXJ23109.1 DUF2637 domain-containing protein [Actinomadura graeca]